MDVETIWLTAAFLVVATVYAAVGQAGASGYIAVMAIAGFGAMAMKTTALALNLLVALIGTALFLTNGRLSWRNVWPFALLGFPFSLLGGATHLSEHVYYPVVGLVLILSGILMVRSVLKRNSRFDMEEERGPPFAAALATGAIIGFVSGTTGTGGGVFLAPVILAMRWGTVRQTAATTAVYNLLNSAAALLGAYASWGEIPREIPLWLLAAGFGGAVGALVGSRYLSDRWLRGILALLLLTAGGQLLL